MPDDKVLKLRNWRNNVICHRNLDLTLSNRDDFFKRNGFDDSEIQYLIESGFSILGHWANCYSSDYARSVQTIDDSITRDQNGIMPALENFLKTIHR